MRINGTGFANLAWLAFYAGAFVFGVVIFGIDFCKERHRRIESEKRIKRYVADIAKAVDDYLRDK